MKKGAFLVTAGLLVFFNSCQKENQHQSQNTRALQNSTAKTNASSVHIGSAVATDWYKLQLRMILSANPATNNALNAEAFAYMGIGLYESVRSGIKNSISLSKSLYQMPEMPEQDNNGYDLEVSANATLASLVRRMYPWLTTANKASVDSLENIYNENLSVAMESEKFQRSQEYGRNIAAIIYNWSTTDNYNVSNAGYTLPTSPVGVYIPTPPNFVKPVLPFISFSRPFLTEDGSGVCPPPLFAYSEDPSSDFYKMVRDLYDISKTLTSEQRTMALYWNDVGIGVGYGPVGHVMNVVTEAIDQNGVDLGIAAQAYAKSGIAIREAQLLCFRSKYQYLQMRPVSYIRKVIDPTWLPLIPTPTHPEYPAAHAYITTMVMTALTSVLGNDVGVVDHTYDFRGFAPRTFESLIKVGEESGFSRRYGGIHYLPSIIVGLSEGKALGTRIGNIKLQE
ncbi:MAG TPA: vanadium-dependent haloperoxidase [Chitinophagaceae bacterium]|nr:vanadium-dependent haloperoxidase [Chitinophagaceae bacterium]